MQAVILGTSGMNSRQSLNASSLHARRCSGVPAENPDVEKAQDAASRNIT
jgi:hypothetical protein